MSIKKTVNGTYIDVHGPKQNQARGRFSNTEVINSRVAVRDALVLQAIEPRRIPPGAPKPQTP